MLLCGNDKEKVNDIMVNLIKGIGLSIDHNQDLDELIASVASSAGLSKSDATRAIESFLDSITNALKRDEKVRIVGFGNFSVSHRKATTGRNPRTGESIQIPASKRPKFTVGKALKDSVNN